MKFLTPRIILLAFFFCIQGMFFAQSFPEDSFVQYNSPLNTRNKLSRLPANNLISSEPTPRIPASAQNQIQSKDGSESGEITAIKDNTKNKTKKSSKDNNADNAEPAGVVSSISSTNLANGQAYESPFLRAELLFNSSSEWTLIEINGDKIKPVKNQGLYSLNYVIEFKTGFNKIEIKGHSKDGSVVSRTYNVFFPEKNINYFTSKALFVELEAGLFYDSNPLFINGDSSDDRSKDAGYFRRLGGRAYFFYDSKRSMSYKFMDKTYLDNSKNGRADYFTHNLAISQLFSPGIAGMSSLLELKLQSININSNMYSGEIGLLGAVDANIGNMSKQLSLFYRVSLYGAEKNFISGERERINPWYLDLLIGGRKPGEDDYYSFKVLFGKDSDGYQNNRFQYAFAGIDLHNTFFNAFKLLLEALYGEMIYETDTTQTAAVGSNEKKVTVNKQLINLYLIYLLGQFEIQYIFQYDDAKLIPYSESIAGTYQYTKNTHGINLLYRF